MADGYDLMYSVWLTHRPANVAGKEMQTSLRSVFHCRIGGKLVAHYALSGEIEHRCPRCNHRIGQSREEYLRIGDSAIVDCPLIVTSRQKRGRVR